jgi:hypothetical protein
MLQNKSDIIFMSIYQGVLNNATYESMIYLSVDESIFPFPFLY